MKIHVYVYIINTLAESIRTSESKYVYLGKKTVKKMIKLFNKGSENTKHLDKRRISNI